MSRETPINVLLVDAVRSRTDHCVLVSKQAMAQENNYERETEKVINVIAHMLHEYTI